MVDALSETGAEATWKVWDDPAVEWSAYDIVVIRETWDYPESWTPSSPGSTRSRPWAAWSTRLRSCAGTTTSPICSSCLVEGPCRADSGRGAARAGGGRLVRCRRQARDRRGRRRRRPGGQPVSGARRGHLRGLLPGGDVLVQPYLSSVETDGETSVILLGGQVSHGVRKLPAQGEFRVHEHRGGSYELVDPTARNASRLRLRSPRPRRQPAASSPTPGQTLSMGPTVSRWSWSWS